MNRKKLGFLSVAVMLFMTSCLKDMEMKTARAGNKFLIDLPKSMAESDRLKPGADLQFAGNAEFPLNFYAVTDEKTDQKTMGVNFTSEELYFLETEEIGANGHNARVSLPRKTTLQYLGCLRGDVYLTADGKEQQFIVLVCEGGARFYRLVMFGDTEAMKKHHKAVEQIFESFREWTEFQAQTSE